MIKARHHLLYVRFFNWYSKFMLDRHFNQIRYHDQIKIGPKSLLIIGNHFSWWDGFFVIHFNNLIFKKKFHVMMLEEQLKKRMFLSRIGMFSVKKMSRDIIESLKYSGSILSDSDNLLLLYPQGEIQSQHLCSFQFEKGLEVILEHSTQMPQILFIANLIEYYSDKKPSLDVYFKIYEDSYQGILKLQKAYNEFFVSCIERQRPS